MRRLECQPGYLYDRSGPAPRLMCGWRGRRCRLAHEPAGICPFAASNGEADAERRASTLFCAVCCGPNSFRTWSCDGLAADRASQLGKTCLQANGSWRWDYTIRDWPTSNVVESADGASVGEELVIGTLHVGTPPMPDQTCALIPATCASQPGF